MKERVAIGSALVIVLLLVSGAGFAIGARSLIQAGTAPTASTTTLMTTFVEGGNSIVLVLSVYDGAPVCPAALSWYGQAVWDAESDTCTMSSAPYAPGPLCISASAGGCTTHARSDSSWSGLA